jgi:hypothetical protein
MLGLQACKLSVSLNKHWMLKRTSDSDESSFLDGAENLIISSHQSHNNKAAPLQSLWGKPSLYPTWVQ